MSVDIATLGLEVRSDGVVVASDRLKQLTAEGGKAEAATNQLSSSFANATKYIQAAVAAMAAFKIAEYAKDATMLAARVETLGVVMKVVGNNAGYTGVQMDAFAKQVQKMGITTQESMNSLIKMAGAQMDLTKASNLARVAQDAAVIGNINSSEAFGRMIQGIRSGETEILKNIGINVQFEQAYKNAAQTLGKTTEQLSATEKTAIRMNAVLDYGKNIAGAYEASMGTAGKQLLSMARYTEELSLAWGQVGLPSLTILVQELTAELKELNKQTADGYTQIQTWASAAKYITTETIQAFRGVEMAVDGLLFALAKLGALLSKTLELVVRFVTFGQFGDMLSDMSSKLSSVGDAFASRFSGVLDRYRALDAASTDTVGSLMSGYAKAGKAAEGVASSTLVTFASLTAAGMSSEQALMRVNKQEREMEDARIKASIIAKAKEKAAAGEGVDKKGLKEAERALRQQEQFEKDYLADMEKWRKAREQLADTYDNSALAAAEQRRDRELAILKNQYDQCLLSQADYLDKQYQQQVAASDKALDQLEAAALRNDQAYYAALKAEPAKPTDGNPVAVEAYNKAILLTVKLLQESEAAWAKVDAAAAKSSTAAIVNEGAKAAIQRENAKAALGFEAQLLQSAGETYAATLKQIEADKIGRKPIDEKTDALRNQLDAVKALKAAQDDANRISAIKDSTTDINISMADSDPAAQQMAAMEERYRREAELIQQNIDLKFAAGTLEMEEYKLLTAKLLAMGKKRDKDLADNKLDQDRDTWTEILNTAKKAVPKLAAFDKLLAVSFQKFETEKGDATRLSTKGMLDMTSAYTGAAGDMFQVLADTQDQSSREGFESAKALNIASAVMNTAAGITKALAQGGIAGVATGAIVAAMGAIQIANIASTTFGGAATAPSAPAGSFAASSTATTSGTGLANLQTPLMNIEDTRTEETYARMIASTDNVAVAIGRLSKTMEEFAALFEEGGAGMGLVNNAPGLDTTLSKLPTAMSKIWGDVKTIISGDIVKNLNPATFFESTMNFLFGGSVATTGAGITLAVNNGVIGALDYVTKKKDGGLFGSDKTWSETAANPAVATYLTSLVQPFIADIYNMAKTLGSGVDTSRYTAAPVNIATAGRSQEDIAKDLEKWTLETLQGLALTVDGLQANVGAYDDAYAMLRKYNDALVTMNNSFLLIGKTALQGSFATAKWADSIITLMGGTEDFTEAMDGYFSSMFTEAEQEAAKAAEANRQVNLSFLDMASTLEQIGSSSGVPKTREEFRNLVNSLDVTTDSGARLFASLIDVSEAFGTVADAADAAADKMRDLSVRSLQAQGNDAQADLLQFNIDAQQELVDAIQSNMSDAYIARLVYVHGLERAALLQTSGFADDLKTAFDNEKTRLTDLYNTELATLNERLTATKTLVSTLTGYINKLATARKNMVLADAVWQRNQYSSAQSLLAAVLVQARGGDLSGIEGLDDTLNILTKQGADAYANSTDYQRDFWQTSNSISELESIAGYQLTDAEKAVALAEEQISLLKINHDAQLAALDAQLNALLGINTSVLSLADALAAFSGASKKLPTTTDPIEGLYNTILNRTSDAGGQAYYTDLYKSGAASLSDIATSMINSPENQINQLYTSVLGRDADTSGATYWQSQLSSGMSTADITAAMMASDEYRASHSYAVGSAYIPYDQVANIHQGEMIIDKQSADIMRRYGIQANGSADNSELIAEVRALRQELRAANTENVKWSQKTAKLLDRVMPDGDALEVRIAA